MFNFVNIVPEYLLEVVIATEDLTTLAISFAIGDDHMDSKVCSDLRCVALSSIITIVHSVHYRQKNHLLIQMMMKTVSFCMK